MVYRQRETSLIKYDVADAETIMPMLRSLPTAARVAPCYPQLQQFPETEPSKHVLSLGGETIGVPFHTLVHPLRRDLAILGLHRQECTPCAPL